MKILVTAGGTKEFIDGVRYIGNCSSGGTGAQLSNYLNAQGHEVTWLGAKSAIKPQQDIQQITSETFDDLAGALEDQLTNHVFDVVSQAAAVSDFKVAAVILDGQRFEAGRGVKLPTADQVQLDLIKQPKLVSHIKQTSSNPHLQVVAFKLTNSMDKTIRQAAVDKLIEQDVIDFVAHNDLNDFNDEVHAFEVHSKQSSSHCKDIQAVADLIVKQLEVAA